MAGIHGPGRQGGRLSSEDAFSFVNDRSRMSLWLKLDQTTPLSGTFAATVGGTITVTGSTYTLATDVPGPLSRYVKSVLFATTGVTPLATAALLRGSNFTLGVWVKPNIATSAAGSVLSGSLYSMLIFGPGYHGYPGQVISDQSGNPPLILLPDAGWHHVAWVVDASAGVITTYIDGIATGVNPTSGYGVITEIQSIGNFFSFGGFPFIGNMLDLRLYHIVLSPAEVAALYAGA
jgi:hypothetical protein